MQFLKSRAEGTEVGSKLRTPKDHYCQMKIGRTGFHITVAVQYTEKKVECQLVISGQGVRWDPDAAFDLLRAQRDSIEVQVGPFIGSQSDRAPENASLPSVTRRT